MVWPAWAAQVWRRPGPRRPWRSASSPGPIVARAHLLDRLLYLGDDPARIARTFKAESLRLLTVELGGFLGVPKYGLAAQLIGRRDTLLRSMQHDLTNGT